VSTDGLVTITLQFSLDRNIDAAAQDVQSAIARRRGRYPRRCDAADAAQGEPGRRAD
jgi:HAE1 family hydrophobic/amphiphilic exporter-1